MCPCQIVCGEKTVMPDLAVGLIKVRDAIQRSAEEGIPPYVVELTATICNRGDALADETITRFCARGADLDSGWSIPQQCRRATRSRLRQHGMSATVAAIT
jgi:hypothetical protein